MKSSFFSLICVVTCASIILNSCSNPTDVPANRKTTVLQNSTDVVDIDDNIARTWLIKRYPTLNNKISAEVGKYTDIPVDIINTSPDKSVRISEVSLAGDVSDFNLISVPAMPLVINKKGGTGDVAQVIIRYSPTQANKLSNIILRLGGKDNKSADEISIKALSSLSDTLSSDDYPEYLFAEPDTSEVNIGPALVGESVQLAYTVTNTSSSWLSIPSAKLSGSNSSAFSYSGASFPLYMAPGESKVMQIKFTPSSVGYTSAKLQFGTKIEVTVFGLGGFIDVNDYYDKTGLKLDSQLDFGKVAVGEEAERTIEINNASNYQLWIHHHSIMDNTPNLGDFTIVSQSPVVYPNNVGPGTSVRYTIKYKPSVATPALMEIYLGDKSTGTPRYNLITVKGEGK
jgi:hypothetical protein